MLSSVSDDTINIRNSFKLVSRLKDLVINENDFFLVSFDAVSLFTCIPISLVMEAIKSK